MTKEQSFNIGEIFKGNSEIAVMFNNNKESYQEYLNSIFPDSKVKDIVWHGTENKDLRFIENNTNGYFAKMKKGSPNAIFFSKDKAPAESVFNREYILSALLNVKNPYIRDDKNDRDNYPESYKKTIESAEKSGNDGVIILNTFDNFKTDVFVVFNPERIHILGSQEDLKGAKEWLKDKNN